ncbi:hypothetical protein Tco_1005758 [Tanacetum coccineum]|uniref:Uncharacterized protein n=1 Tax=Tanacetum coccineum TaxID=301880 RepID=A0ABQ5FFX1_9ASTR
MNCTLNLHNWKDVRLVIGKGKRDATTVDINAGKHVDIVVDDEVLHKLVSMVEKNDLFEELIIAVVDTELNLTEFDSEQPMQEDL